MTPNPRGLVDLDAPPPGAPCPDRRALRAELVEAGRQAWRWTQREIELRARLDDLELGAPEARDG